MESHQVLASEPTTPQPTTWTRQPDEPTMWFDRFNTYRTLGPGRSIRSAYFTHSQPNTDSQHKPRKTDGPSYAPSSWYKNADKYDWKTRASAFDQYDWKLNWSDEEKLREQSRQLRIKAATTLLETALRQVQENGLKEALSPAIKTAMRELREELDGYSTRSTVDVNIILAKLQPELQKLLQSALKPNK